MHMKIILPISILLFVSVAISALAETSVPLDLEGVCKLTIQKNQSLASANASVSQSEAALRKVKGQLQPSINIKSSFGYIDKPTFFGTTPILEKNTITHRIELTQPIYTGGVLQASVSAADYAVKAAGGGWKAVRNLVVTNSAVAYMRVMQAKDITLVTQSSVKSLKSSYDAANNLFASGVVTKSDVLRAEVALTNSKEQLITAENNYAIAIAALKTSIGLFQSTQIELVESSNETILIDIDVIKPLRRAELDAAGFAVRAAELQTKAAQGSQKPSVGLMIDFENQPTGSEFPRLTNTAMIGLQANFNVFDGGQTKANIDEAKASLNKAKADLNSVTQETEFQLEASRLGMASAKARVDALATQVKSAEESFRVVETGYKEGINIITDVLSVESMLTSARVSKLAADYDLKIAKLNLLLALGQTQKLIN